ncbi:MAG: hypothetical protein GX807_02070 [Erysipelotrichia bacterium]|nr:hypothetical protein [Erysipelotrichia bacterium]
MKNFHKFGIGLFGLVLALGAGAGIGSGSTEKALAVNYAATADFTTSTTKNAAYNNSWTYASDWTMYGAANNNGAWAFMKFGGKNTTLATANPVYTRGRVAGKNVSQVDVVFNSGNLTAGAINSWGVKIYSDSTYETQIGSVLGDAPEKKTAETISLVHPSSSYWPAGSYYEVYFYCANTTTKNGIVWVDKIQFVEYADTSKNLSSLAFSGTPTTSVYMEGDDFDSTGLTVTATYSDTSTANVTSQVIWEPLVFGMTSVVGTYSYTGTETISKTITVTGITVNEAPIFGGIVDGHRYLITAAQSTSGETKHILKAGAPFAVKNSGDATEVFTSAANYSLDDGFLFTKVDPNRYEITSSTNYLSADGDNNGLVLGTTKDSWTVTEAVGTTTGGVYYNGVFLQDSNSSRYLTSYAKDPNFRTYTSTTSQPLPAACIVLYDITALEGFADSFNTAIGAVCDADGETIVSSLATAWANQAAAFNGLTDTQKAVFADLGAEGDVAGTTMQKAIAKYEYVAAKYNTQLMASGWDFMSRNIAPVSESSSTLINTLNDSSVVLLIVIISLVSVTTIAGTFYLRKRKYN